MALRDNFTDKIELAAYDVAAFAHEGQTRRGTKLPYILHPVAVALKLREFGHSAHHMVAAGLLHDVIEDTRDEEHRLRRVTQQIIDERFGEAVGGLVEALTTPLYVQLTTQPQRDNAEIKRLMTLSYEAKTIKLADIHSNINEVMATDPIFACKYLLRKEMQMPALVGGDAALWTQTYRLIQEKKFWMYRPPIETVELDASAVTPTTDVSMP